MATTTNDKIIAQIGDELVELTGNDLITFNNLRAQTQAELDAAKVQADAKAVEKTALLQRLGLTEDELKTILG